jgi:general secretion pathway protein D
MPEPRIIEEDEASAAPPGLPATTQPEGFATTQPTESVAAATVRKGTLIYTCRYARTEVLKDAVEGLISPEGSVQASPALNTLIITDSLETVRSVLKVLQEIDRPVPQLLVEARVLEITLDSDLEYEVEHLLNIPASDQNSFFQTSSLTLATPGAQPTIGQGAKITIRPWYDNGKYLQEFIRLLITKDKAKILSSPNLLVSAGNEASIITGEEVPIQSSQVVAGSLSTNTQFKRVGIKLRVNLQQITNDTAKLEINPEVSTVTGYTKAEGQGVSNPVIAVRNIASTLSMKDGEVLTVGGLLRDENRETVRGVPLLMDVPYLGLLFQSRRHQKVKTQLIFFMRIHILSDGSPYTTRVYKPGSTMDRIEDKTGIVLPEAAKPLNGALPEGKGQKP